MSWRCEGRCLLIMGTVFSLYICIYKYILFLSKLLWKTCYLSTSVPILCFLIFICNDHCSTKKYKHFWPQCFIEYVKEMSSLTRSNLKFYLLYEINVNIFTSISCRKGKRDMITKEVKFEVLSAKWLGDLILCTFQFL